MVFVPAVTDFLTSAQALFAPATSRLLIKYSGAGTLSLKVTDNKQTLTYRTKQKDDLKHMDKLSLHVLTACTGAAAAAGAGAGAASSGGAGAGAAARKAAPGSGAQRKRAAVEARLAAGKSAVGARTLARQQAKAQREAQRRSRRQERREERLLAGGGSSAAAL